MRLLLESLWVIEHNANTCWIILFVFILAVNARDGLWSFAMKKWRNIITVFVCVCGTSCQCKSNGQRSKERPYNQRVTYQRCLKKGLLDLCIWRRLFCHRLCFMMRSNYHKNKILNERLRRQPHMKKMNVWGKKS